MNSSKHGTMIPNHHLVQDPAFTLEPQYIAKKTRFV